MRHFCQCPIYQRARVGIQIQVPAETGVIVVGARIQHLLAIDVARVVRVRGITRKAELQHAHAGQAELFAQCGDVGRDHAEVFCHQRSARCSV